MTYVKTAWVDDNPPPVNATNLNKIEQGIYDAHTLKLDKPTVGGSDGNILSQVAGAPAWVSGVHLASLEADSLGVRNGADLAIASAAITVTNSFHRVSNTGLLTTINDSQPLYTLDANAAAFLILVAGGGSFTMDESSNIVVPGTSITVTQAAFLIRNVPSSGYWWVVSYV